MLPEGTLAANDIWKRFRAERGRRLLRDQVELIRARIKGTAAKGWMWALQGVDLVAEPGESVGLVGTNGSGKTTLLKILARVMYPYAGEVEVAGRVGALIEVSAGIHPDLTGRENIHLYGSLLGLKRTEVARKFDEIVEFAELPDAIDRQVKYYSSGMKMRLGFAVAASLEPKVLLVDEVLAVGDASFQQKCLERMRQMLAQGTTLIFVSHDLAAVEATCNRVVWLHHGQLQADGEARDVLSGYRQAIEEAAESVMQVAGDVRLVKTEVSGPDGGMPTSQAPLEIKLVLENFEARPAKLFLGVSEGPATPIFVVHREEHLPPGETEMHCTISNLPLPRGRFFLWAGVFSKSRHPLLPWHPAAHFDVSGTKLDAAPIGIVRLAPVHVQSTWEIERR